MAEFLVAARDLDSGYVVGDPITVQDDGHVWGDAETLPDFWIFKVPSISLNDARPTVVELFEDAIPGDDESLAPDIPDRRIKRHRRAARFFIDTLPPSKRNELTATGITTLPFGLAHTVYRRLGFNRNGGQVVDTGLDGFA